MCSAVLYCPVLFSPANLQVDNVFEFQTLTGDKVIIAKLPGEFGVTTEMLRRALLKLPSLSQLLPEDVYLANDKTTILVRRPTITVTFTSGDTDLRIAPTELELTTEHGLSLISTQPTTANYVLQKVALVTGLDASQIELAVMLGPTKIMPNPTSSLDSASIAGGSVLLIQKTAIQRGGGAAPPPARPALRKSGQKTAMQKSEPECSIM
jgi:hypothetical protein